MTPTPDPASDRVEKRAAANGWRHRWPGWLSVFGITGLAIAFPLFRVLGPHPEFFLAHDVGPTGVVVFAVAVSLIVPALVATVATLVGRRSPMARSVLVAIVATVAVAGLLQSLSGFVLFPGVVIGGGIVAASWERHSEAFRSGLAVAAVMSLLVGGWFVGLSRTSSYVFSSDGDPIELVASEELPPVVFLVFDEFPATALLGSDLEINEERFPNFARLASQSDWFWKASSVSPQTSWSVPALWSGTAPSDAVAVGSNYPTNIFRQLGAGYEVFEYEPITALCPDSVCGSHASEAAPARPDTSFDRLVRDTAVVFGHAVGSGNIRDRLPAIDHSWSGFGATALPEGPDSDATAYADLGSEATFAGTLSQLELLVESLPSSDRSPMYVGYFLAPHAPYMATPDGAYYEIVSPLKGMENQSGGLVWPAPAAGDEVAIRTSEAYRRQGYQRLVLQIGALDRALGKAIDTLEESGVWDQAAVVVTADHGATFEPGAFRSVAVGGAEVWNVPLFIKAPGQNDGERRDESALTIDALPTLMALLGLDRGSDFDGFDLESGDVPAIREDGYVDGAGEHTIDQTEDAIRDIVERRADWFSPDGSWDELLKVGPAGGLVGGPVPVETDPPAGWWSMAVGESGEMQPFQRIDLILAPDAAVPEGILVAIDGRVVGAGSPVTASDSGSFRVWSIIDPKVSARPDRADVYGVRSDGSLFSLTHGP